MPKASSVPRILQTCLSGPPGLSNPAVPGPVTNSFTKCILCDFEMYRLFPRNGLQYAWQSCGSRRQAACTVMLKGAPWLDVRAGCLATASSSQALLVPGLMCMCVSLYVHMQIKMCTYIPFCTQGLISFEEGTWADTAA